MPSPELVPTHSSNPTIPALKLIPSHLPLHRHSGRTSSTALPHAIDKRRRFRNVLHYPSKPLWTYGCLDAGLTVHPQGRASLLVHRLGVLREGVKAGKAATDPTLFFDLEEDEEMGLVVGGL